MLERFFKKDSYMEYKELKNEILNFKRDFVKKNGKHPNTLYVNEKDFNTLVINSLPIMTIGNKKFMGMDIIIVKDKKDFKRRVDFI